jgi:protein involved in polysaccharide export with SLBB domain
MKLAYYILSLVLFTQLYASNTQAEHVLRANDLVLISVFQEPDLETKARITQDGSVQCPLIGKVKATGKTVEQLSKSIEEMLRKDYLTSPQVNVTLLEQAPRRFTVLGQVQRPGTYRIPEGESIDLLQAIGMAGGYTRIANPRKVTIKRRVDNKDKVIEYNAREMANNQEVTRAEIFPSDIVTVNESFF